MRSRRRIALLLASAGALGVGLIAFPASSAAAPPVVPSCNPVASSGSDSCVRGVISAVAPPLTTGGVREPVRLGTRVRSAFSPANSESTTVIVRFDDEGAINLAGVPTCPSSELLGKSIAAAWEQCGPGADGSPASEGNAYLSTALGANVSGQTSTIPAASGPVGCTMIFKGADNTHITLYARVPIANFNASSCNNPAANTAGTATVLFTGTITNQPAASIYGPTLTVPNTQTANPALDDYYATIQRGSVVTARCPAGQSPLRIQAVFDYTAVGDPTDTVNGLPQACP